MSGTMQETGDTVKKREEHPVFLELETQWKYQMFKEYSVF